MQMVRMISEENFDNGRIAVGCKLQELLKLVDDQVNRVMPVNLLEHVLVTPESAVMFERREADALYVIVAALTIGAMGVRPMKCEKYCPVPEPGIVQLTRSEDLLQYSLALGLRWLGEYHGRTPDNRIYDLRHRTLQELPRHFLDIDGSESIPEGTLD